MQTLTVRHAGSPFQLHPAAFRGTTMKRLQAAPYVRKTVPLRGTVSRLEAQLDHPSKLAIDFARRWLKSGPAEMQVDVLASGVIRRSLLVYVSHLGSPGLDPAQEAAAVKRCCGSTTPDEEDARAAFERLDQLPLPAWPDVLTGPDARQRIADLNDRAEAMAEQLIRDRAQHLRKRKEPTQ